MGDIPTNRGILDALVEFSHAVGNRFERVDSSLAEHWAILDEHSRMLRRHEQRFDAIGQRFDAIDLRFGRIDRRLDRFTAAWSDESKPVSLEGVKAASARVTGASRDTSWSQLQLRGS